MNYTLAAISSANKDMCVKMAVGSNIENITDAAALHRPMSEFHEHDSEQCCGLPYQDHNYGARPPPPPTPPLSPNELNSKPCFKPLLKTNARVCLASHLPTVSPPSFARVLPCHNGIQTLKRAAQNNASLFFPLDGNIPSESILEDVTRCICGFTHDDGYMICCDRCSVWQHIDCMNIDRNDIPDTYLCDKCNPRPVNQSRAADLQAKKRKDLSRSERESSDPESDDISRSIHPRVTYTSHQSTPTSLTITSNRTAKRVLSNGGSAKKRKRSREDGKKSIKRIYPDKKPRSRSHSKSSNIECMDEDQISMAFSWEKKLREWSESYNEAHANKYTPELLQAVLSASSKVKENKNETPLLDRLHLQLAKVQQLRNQVMAMEDICLSKPLAEVTGDYMLSNQFEGYNSVLYKRPYPYVFFYTGFDGLEICVDARTSGNIARYMRRSCSPNSELRHILENNELHLFVYSKKNIPSGSEITIPFDFKYQNCTYEVECVCSCATSCPVYQATSLNTELQLNSKQQRASQDSQNKKRLPPLVLSIPKVDNNRTNGYISSDPEVPRVNGEGGHEDHAESHRKKSREERKMEAYIRAFEKLEKEEKRKEQYHNVHRDDQPSAGNTTKCSDSTTSKADSGDGCLSPSHVTPQRRTSRKRSTKGSRRGSVKKSRVTSLDAVLSPGAVAETDSCDSLAPLNGIAENTASVCGEKDRLASAEVPAEQQPTLASPSTSLNQTDLPVLEESCQVLHDTLAVSTDHDVDRNCDATQTRDDSEAQLTCEPNESAAKEPTVAETVDKPELLEGEESARRECVTTAVESNGWESKSSKSKKCSASDAPRPAVPSAKPSAPTTAGPNVDTAPACNFHPWEYRPGVPSGHVHIGIGFAPERKRSRAEKHTKKRWLDQATQENLVPRAQSLALPVAEPERVSTALKKRLLKRFLTRSDDQDVLELAEQTSNAMAVAHAATASAPQPAASSRDGLPVSSELSQITAEAARHNSRQAFPAIEYENLSDDEDAAACNNQRQTFEENEGVSPREASEDRQCTRGYLGGAGMPHADNVALSTLTVQQDDVQTAPAKKKVSLQEYKKRAKSGAASTKPVTTTAAPSTTSSLSTFSATVLPDKLCETSRSAPSGAGTPPRPIPVHAPTLTSTELSLRGQVGNTDVSMSTKIDVTSVSNPGTSLSELGSLSASLTPSAIKTLPPELMDIVSMTVRQLTDATEGKAPPSKVLHTVDSKKRVEDDHKEDFSSAASGGKLSPALPSPARSSCSNESPATRTSHTPVSHRSRSSGSSATESSLSWRSRFPAHIPSTSPALSPGTPRSVASPHSARTHSASSVHSPATPTSHDQKHGCRTNVPHVAKDYTSDSGRSRNNSGASTNSNSTISSKSPRTVTTDSVHQSGKYSGHSTASGHSHKSQQHPRDPPPQQVPSIAPAVPGQPIPSIMRTPGGGRAPQHVYNSRPVLSRQRSTSPPPRWDSYNPPPASRPPRDYSRFYHPSDPPFDTAYRRSSRDDRSPYYVDSRYVASYSQRREDPCDPYPPPAKHSSLPASYYHDQHFPGPSHTSAKPYYSPRDVRPRSPPPPRPQPPDYYAKRKSESSYRTSYYPPDLHRR